MNQFPVFIAVALLACCFEVQAQTQAQPVAAPAQVEVVPNVTMTGKVMSGYQGWFNTATDGANRGWRHWGGNPSQPGDVTVDMWPDMTELDADERYATGFKHKDGRPAEVYSAYNEKTVVRHFKWMRDYGLDGVFLQRFAGEVSNESGRNHFNKVLNSARQGAKEYGRVYGVMYDLSGVRDGGADGIIADWKALFDATKLTQDDRYVRHNNKPVVVLWGLGFIEGGRPALLDDGLKIVNFLKNDP
ncbi:xylosidase/arabinosidase, partial [bacterium]